MTSVASAIAKPGASIDVDVTVSPLRLSTLHSSPTTNTSAPTAVIRKNADSVGDENR